MKRRAWLAVGLVLTALVTTLWAYDARLDRVQLWQEFEMKPGSVFRNRDGNDIAAQLDTLDTVAAADLTKIDGITDGTAAANKALVLGASKEISTITTATITTGNIATVNATNVDAGASGTAGSVDVFPSGATSGKLAITAADSAGDTVTTITNASQADARTYTIPDAGGNADFVMTAGAQTISSVKTFALAPLCEGIDAYDATLAINGLAGTTGNGGEIAITAGNSGAVAAADGGPVTISAGGSSATNGAGGAASLLSGGGTGTGNGGLVSIVAGGSGAGATGDGGALALTGGRSYATNGEGGDLTIRGGLANGTGAGGDVSIAGGESAGASGTAGAVGVDAGAANGGTGAAVTIGATNATNVALGRSAGTVTVAGGIRTSVGVGAVAGTGVTLGSEAGDGLYHQTTITLTDVEIALTDEAGVIAYGGLKIYDLPVGAIVVQAAVSDLDVTKSSAGVNVDWDGDFSLGTTTAGNDADLTTTEVDILAKTATPTAAAGATTANGGAATNGYLDGTTTAGAAKDVYLNVLVDDADHDVTSTPCNLIFNGTIKLTWFVAGDY